MVVWSSIYRLVAQPGLSNFYKKSGTIQSIIKNVQVRQMSGHERTMHIQPSRFQWNKWKDYLHFYSLIGAIPCLTVIFLTNVFIGPATLEPIPEGYRPKHWEYHRHPISRFMSKWIYSSPQERYERGLHAFYVYEEKRQLMILEEKIKQLIKKRRDYEAYYYKPVSAKDVRLSKEAINYLESIWGDF